MSEAPVHLVEGGLDRLAIKGHGERPGAGVVEDLSANHCAHAGDHALFERGVLDHDRLVLHLLLAL